MDTDYSNYTILIIEDDLVFARYLQVIISKRLKAKVIHFHNPAEGLDYLKRSKPSLLLLDMQLPVMDGFAVLNDIRSNPAISDLQVIPCTALSHQSLVLGLFKLGVSDYIVKPSDEKLIIEKIQRVLKNLKG